MIKLKRYLALFIDFYINCFIMEFFRTIVLMGVDNNSIIDPITTIVFVGLSFLLIITKDATVQKRSFGKHCMKLVVISEDENLKVDSKKLLLRGLISTITFPVSFFTILIFNKTIGDFVCRTIVMYNPELSEYYEQQIKEAEISLNSSIRGKTVLLGGYTLLMYVLITYTCLQKLNYYSLRLLLLILLVVVFVVIVIRKIRIKNKRNMKFGFIIMIVIFLYLYSDTIEMNMLKQKTLLSAFDYNFPQATVVKEYDLGDYGFIFYENKGEYNAVHYINKDNNWLIKNWNILEEESLVKMYNDFSTNNGHLIINKSHIVIINVINKLNKSFVIFQADKKVDKVIDAFNSKFEEIVYNDKYNYITIIEHTLDNEYFIEVGDDKYFPYSK